jgi:hypothetical protein
MMQTNLRLYTFCNFYLNSISQGIQTAHVLGRMAKFYRGRTTEDARLFWDWLTEGGDNETIIVLNGGMAADVEEAYRKFEPMLTTRGLPSNIFYEEPRALGSAGSKGAPTCWGVVLPEPIYNARLIKDYPMTNTGSGFENVFGKVDEFGNTSVVATQENGLYGSLYEFLEYKNRCSFAR